MTDPTLPSTEAVGEVRRQLEQVLGALDVDAIERRWLARCAACDAGLPEYGCSHPDEDYRPTMLRLVGEVRRLRALQRTVLLFGQGFIWRDPATGQEKLLAPQDVTVVLRAEQTELWPDPEGWLPPLAAEKLFEQRDTAIAELQRRRTTERDEPCPMGHPGETWWGGQCSKPAGHDVHWSQKHGTVWHTDRDAWARLEAERDTAIRERDEAQRKYKELLTRTAADIDEAVAVTAEQMGEIEAERDQALADLKAFSGEVERLYAVERNADRMQPVVEAAKALVAWWQKMQPDDSPTHPMAPLAAAVDAYTKEASDDRTE